MGREVRRVPAGWQHPTDTRGNYLPMHDRDYTATAAEWMRSAIEWDRGTHEDLVKEPGLKLESPFYWQWAGEPPDPKYYRPKWTDEERTHYQAYENVSEGTPITPVFATADELIDHLVAHGTEWDDGGWSRQEAKAFVARGFAFTGIIVPGVGLLEPKDQGAALDRG